MNAEFINVDRNYSEFNTKIEYWDDEGFKTRLKPKPHWYKLIHEGCIVCGGTFKRKRIYGIKPDNIEDRCEMDYRNDAYCGCLV